MFKSKGITIIRTHTGNPLKDKETGLSTLADTVILLDFITEANKIRTTITVLKNRGSLHDRGVHLLSMTPHGIQITRKA